MNKDNKAILFLLGGNSAYSVYADDFVKASGGKNAQIATLMQTRAGWDKYHSEIVEPWKQRGVSQIEVIVPNDEGKIEIDSASAILNDATGIFIGGGHTPTYHKLYATEPVKSIVRKRFQDGIPIAGISAGALISMEWCQLTPDETGKSEIEVVEGLGLVRDFILGVHFSEWNALPEVLNVMKATQTSIGIGLDEPACAVCENGKIVKVLGKTVHKIEMKDFDLTVYEKSILQWFCE